MKDIKELEGNIEVIRNIGLRAVSAITNFTELIKNDGDATCAIIAILAQNAADTPSTDGTFSEDDGSALLDFVSELGMQAGLLELIMRGKLMINHDKEEKCTFRLTNAGAEDGKKIASDAEKT